MLLFGVASYTISKLEQKNENLLDIFTTQELATNFENTDL
jgi:hypothetical protein